MAAAVSRDYFYIPVSRIIRQFHHVRIFGVGRKYTGTATRCEGGIARFQVLIRCSHHAPTLVAC